MSIKQFSGEWVNREDRVLFRFNTTQDEEYLFWLTRFMVKSLIRASQQLAMQTLEKDHPPEVAQVMQEFQQHALTQQANFKEAYQAPSQRPLGDEPLLVTRIAINQSDAQISVDFQVTTQKNINIQLTPEVFQVVATLLNKLQDSADWGVGFDNEPLALEAEPAMPRLVH